MLTVNDLMTVKPRTVMPGATLREVIRLMTLEACRQLPVVDERGQLVGIITDRDVRLALNSPIVLHEYWRDEALIDTATVAGCMTPQPLTVTPDMPAYRAAQMLSVYKLGALPVVDKGELVGIISVTDFLDQFATTAGPPLVLDNEGERLDEG